MTCAYCHYYWPFYFSDEANICPSCSSVLSCHCGRKNPIYLQDAILYCRRCLKGFAVCGRCRIRIPRHLACTLRALLVCKKCISNLLIYPYSYKPVPIFISTEADILCDNKYYGLELEFDYRGNRAVALENMPSAFYELDSLEKFFYFKHDSSICSGLELVTHPFSFNALYEIVLPLLGRVLSYLKAAGFFVSSLCGLHVHVTRDILLDTQVESLIHFFHLNHFYFRKILRRRPNIYCNTKLYWNSRQRFFSRPRVSSNYEDTRNTPINIKNSSTLEFRSFRGTEDIANVEAAVVLVASLISFIKSHGAIQVLKANVGTYKRWLEQPANSQYHSILEKLPRV